MQLCFSSQNLTDLWSVQWEPLPSHQILPPTEKLETIFIYLKEIFLFEVHKRNTWSHFHH